MTEVASAGTIRVIAKPAAARSERKLASVRSRPPITSINSSIIPTGRCASITFSIKRPLEHRLGFHQLGRRLPSGPYLGQQHPQEAKRRVKPRVGLSLLADTFFVKGELTAHGYHLTSP